jgi:Undecaprenyl-phosphate glucose phosphotransferase
MALNDKTDGRRTPSQVLPGQATALFRSLEALSVVGVGLAMFLFYVHSDILVFFSGGYLIAVTTAVLMYYVLSQWIGAYDRVAQLGDPVHTARALGAWMLTFAILLAVAFLLKISSSYSRIYAVGWFAGTTAMLLVLRIGFGRWVAKRVEHGQLAFRTVIVGLGTEARELADLMRQKQDHELRFLGFIDDGGSTSSTDGGNVEALGGLDHLVRMIRGGQVDQVVIALPGSTEERFRNLLYQLSVTPVRVCVLPFPPLQVIRDGNLLQVSGIPMVEVLRTPMSGGQLTLKWLEDRILGSLLLLFVGPLMLLIAAAIKLDSQGPVFFRQKRQGYNNSLIEVWKFRSMYANMADANCAQQTTRDDPRITRVGRFLRQTSLDELPQLINVLNGTMSLVGPRPHALETKAEGVLFEDVVDRYAARHRVKPGITGFAQVMGWRGETDSIAKIKGRVECDLYYIGHWSLWLDFWIMAKTIWVILKGENAY